jgi:hypothetical protein
MRPHSCRVSTTEEMIAHRAGQFVGKAVNEAEDQWSLAWDGSGRVRRAVRRVAWSAIGWLPLLICLGGPPAVYSAGNIIVWLAISAIWGVAFILFLRHFGSKIGLRGGVLLWLLSAGVVFGLTSMAWAALGTVLLLGGDAEVGPGTTLFCWIAGALSYGFCVKRIDSTEARAK